MLRRLPAGYFVEIVSHRHLRYGSGLLHLVLLGTNVALVASRRAWSTTWRSGSSSHSSLAALRRGLPRYYALVDLGDCRLALGLPRRGCRRPGIAAEGRGEGEAVDQHVRE